MTRFPTPREVGLPDHFDHWRPAQQEAISFLQQSTKRIRALCAPTGFGKTDTVVTDALLSKKPTAFVTESRALQDAYMDRYISIGMVDLRGRHNYSCLLHPDQDYRCDQGYAARCPAKGTHKCPASFAEMRASASYSVVTNYDKWIHSRKFGQGLAHIQRVVFDEGDEAVNAISRAMQVILHHKEIEGTLGLSFPDPHEAHFFDTWRVWAVEARAICEIQMLLARDKIIGVHPRPSWVKHYLHLRHLMRRLSILATAAKDNWVVEELPKGYQFDPISVARYSEFALFLKVPEIVIISATLRPKTLHMLGVAKGSFDFREFLSEFDPVRCPIYYVPTMRVDYKATDFSPLWLRLDQIASPRRDRNGIVHSISYLRADDILSRSRWRDSMLVNERGEPATEMVNLHKASYPGSILVSPSVGRGFDFKFKDSEWQLICKVPFPPPSKILEARTAFDADYPRYIAWQKLAQAAGRIMRDKADRGETFICDDHLTWFMRYSYLAPKSFAQFLKRVDVLPQPPPRLI